MSQRNMDGLIAFRLHPDVRAAVDQYCDAHGMTISEFYRGMTEAALSGQLSMGGVEGFKAARGLAIVLAESLFTQAKAGLPDSIEEAMARGLIAGNG